MNYHQLKSTFIISTYYMCLLHSSIFLCTRCWLGPGSNPAGGRISVAALVAYLAMLSLWLACRETKWTDTTYHSLGMQQQTCVSAIGWGNYCKQFKLSHKPNVDGLNCGEWQYNKHNFIIFLNTTLLYFTLLPLTLTRILKGSQQRWGYKESFPMNRSLLKLLFKIMKGEGKSSYLLPYCRVLWMKDRWVHIQCLDEGLFCSINNLLL